MNKVVLFKRSLTPGSQPEVENIKDGELAVNVVDGKIFLRKNNEDGDRIVEALPTFEDMDIQSSILGNEILKNTVSITNIIIPDFEE